MVPQSSLCFKNFPSFVGDEFGCGNALLIRPEGMMKADCQFGAKGKTPRVDRARPNHDFIQQGADNPAVHRLLKPSVLAPRDENALNQASIRLEAQIKPYRIQLPANKT